MKATFSKNNISQMQFLVMRHFLTKNMFILNFLFVSKTLFLFTFLLFFLVFFNYVVTLGLVFTTLHPYLDCFLEKDSLTESYRFMTLNKVIITPTTHKCLKKINRHGSNNAIHMYFSKMLET